MKKIFFTLLCALSVLTTANAQSGTREMRIVPLDGASLRQENGAWVIRLADIDSIHFQTINSTAPDEGEGVEPDGQEHAYVDLGLPSGTLWATCNIGAATPLEKGDRFAWGEVKPKEVHNKNTYKWFKMDTVPAYSYTDELGFLLQVPEQVTTYITKYNTSASNGEDGFTDGKQVLDSIDDAAAVNWGGTWRTPTSAQINELRSNCTWEWHEGTNSDGKYAGAYKVIGPNGNFINLPATVDGDLYGLFWSSSLNASNPEQSYYLYFNSGSRSLYNAERYYERVIRPVRANDLDYTLTLEADATMGSVTGAGTYKFGTSVTLTATAKEGYYFYAWSDGNTDNPRTFVVNCDSTITAKFDQSKYENGYEYIDLGLPSGTLWATCNVGATNPEDYGDYFAWGETTTKSTYDWSTYKYCNGSDDTQTKYCTSSSYGTVDNKTTLEASDDAATANWGGIWRMPTYEEQQELIKECTWAWTTLNGVNGYRVMGPNGKSIFLPAAGYRSGSDLNDAGSLGNYYWSSSLYSDSPYFAYDLRFDLDYCGWGNSGRCYGLSVRPVCSSR